MIDLLPQQVKATNKINPNKVGALFMQMGTGKTRVAVELINSITEDIDLVVWIGPLRTIKPPINVSSVIDEIDKWGGFKAERVEYMGIETLQSSDRQYLQLHHKIRTAWRCVIIVDESIKIKNAGAKRTQRLHELGKMAEYRYILNGEPITRDLLDLWSQMQFLSPLILNMDIAEFKDTFCKYTTITKKQGWQGATYTKSFITGYENIDYLYSLIGEYIFECDLNLNIERVFEDVTYTLDEAEREEYQLLKTKYLDDKMLLMKNNNIFLELTMKMQHIYCCTESKFVSLNLWLEGKEEDKVVIFCKYILSQEECKKRYPKALILSYQSNAFGLNLQHLPYIVMFDKTFDWGLRRQALARNFRTGSVHGVRCLDLTGDVGLEKLINDNNKKKLSITEYFKSISKEKLKEIL